MRVRRALPAAVAAACMLAAPAPAGAATPLTGRLLVTLRPGAGAHAAAAARLAAAGARVSGPRVARIGLVTVRPRAGVSMAAAEAALRALPGVADVRPERRFTPRFVPDDPALSTPEPLQTSVPVEWWAARENLPAAWDISRGTHAVVAIIDTGVDANHPDLAGKISGSADHDDDPNTGAATVDEVGHGTNVASLACAQGDNGIGLVGAGLDCRLLILKSDFTESSVAASIIDAVDRGADAINMSFGTDGSSPASPAITDAIDYAYRRGVVLVAAAADDPLQEQGDPANVLQPTGTGADITKGKGLSVTAAAFDDHRAPFAGLGSQISIAAYGSFGESGGPGGIFGAFTGNSPNDLERFAGGRSPCNCRTTFQGDNRYAYLQGTSMAAPMVTAVAALVRDLNPDLDASTIIEVLKRTARRPAGAWTSDLGWGILDAGHALSLTRRIDRRAPHSALTRRAAPPGRVRLVMTRHDRAPAHCVASGVKKVQVYRAVDGGPFKRILTTGRSGVTLTLRGGHRYAFYSRAVDKAGNREARPAKPDVRLSA